MNAICELRTERLCLRRWRAEDRAPFGKLNSDPRVMEFFPGALSPQESDALAERVEAHFLQHRFGLWAVEIPGVTPFAGFIGLAIPRFEAHFTPCVEIGGASMPPTGTGDMRRKARGRPWDLPSSCCNWNRSSRSQFLIICVPGG